MGTKRRDPTAELAFTHATVIDGTDRAPRTNTTVIVSEGRITYVGAAPPSRGATRMVDCEGKFLIPGLWDMHVHFCNPGAGPEALEQFVRRGITTVRDLGGNPWQIDAWREEIRTGHRVGPHIFRAGPFVDGPKPFYRLAPTTPSEARAVVTTLRAVLGVDTIKVHDALPRRVFLALAEEATNQGIPLVAHLPREVSAEEAAESGCRSLEHAAESLASSLMFHSGQQPLSVEEAANRLVGSEGSRIFRTLQRARSWVDPTLVAYDTFAHWDEKTDPASVAPRLAILSRLIAATATMRKLGVGLLAGSDFAGEWNRADVRDELRFLHKAGLSPQECLQVATRDAATFMGQVDTVGTVEPGKTADLVVLEKDPLTDLRNLETVVGTVFGGRWRPAVRTRTVRPRRSHR